MLGHSRVAWATLLLPLFAALIALGLPGPAAAAGEDLSLTLSAPATARIGSNATVRATLLNAEQLAVVGANVQLQSRSSDGDWTTIAGSVTTSEGIAGFSVVVPVGSLVLRARFGGDEDLVALSSAPVTVDGVVVTGTLFSHGPQSVVDEQVGELLMRWAGSDGLPVVGRVVVYQHARNQPWTKLGATTTRADGRATVRIRPRVDMYYQFRGEAGTGWEAATSATWLVDNKPPMAPAAWPSTAPRPLALPSQRRAVGSDANFVAQVIPDSVWSRMVGRSWHSGCPIGRSGLRYVTVNYWGFDGYRHRGELVVRASVAGKFAVALTKLYNARVPIRAMYLPDRFGKNGNAPGANDVQSMRHDNTSAFNCRAVTGDPGTRSPHAYGGSIDINPWENPFHSHVGWLPNAWWSKHQAGLYSWRSGSRPVVQMMRAAGFSWTYGNYDAQHFDS